VNRVRVVVASSDRLFADAAGAYVDAERDLEVVGVVTDGVHLLAAIARHSPDAALVIGSVPRIPTPTVVRRIRRQSARTRVVVVGSSDGDTAGLPARATAAEVLSALRGDGASDGEETAGVDHNADLSRVASLTPRERATFGLLLEGLDREAIAGRLGISADTVRTHTQHVYAKLGVHRRTDLISLAARLGIGG
jgi:DNA-binding NarL/FixJ family response regulator